MDAESNLEKVLGRSAIQTERPLRLDRSLLRRKGQAPRPHVSHGGEGTLVEDGDVFLDFRALLEAAPDGIAVVDQQGKILVVNEQLSAMFGFEASELVGQEVELLIPPSFIEPHRAHREGYSAKPNRRPMGLGMDLVGLRKDGTEVPVEISLSPITSGKDTLTIAVVRDVSEQRQLRVEGQTLRSALDTEQERYRIGMDLHDGIMQDIFASTLTLELAQALADDERFADAVQVARAVKQLQDVLRDIRSYIFDLRPRQFSGDISQALFELGREFQDNSSILTKVSSAPALPQVEYEIGIALYVITHEALSNIRKSAYANNVQIGLSADDGGIQLEVRDDGRGFDVSAEMTQEHRGLRNMASRASGIGAELSIDSAPGQGTVVRVDVRLS